MRPFNSRNVFDLSHENKLTCDMGKLVPFYVEEVLPGDTFKVTSQLVVRLAPMLAPIMHKVDVFTHFFFVPNRLIYDKWEDFITGGKDGRSDVGVPTINSPADNGFAIGSLADYLGVPTGVPNLPCLAFPFRAYDKIYNDWYRDETIQDEAVISLDTGVDTLTERDLKTRCWKKDYFTSALPFTQRGEQAFIPVGNTAPVVYGSDVVRSPETGYSTQHTEVPIGNSISWNVPFEGKPVVAGHWVYNGSVTGTTPSNASEFYVDSDTAHTTSNTYILKAPLVADLSQAGAVSINDMRTAFQIQRWMELNARAGYRYVEQILSHFGVRSSDARLQRSEFLGGGRSPIVITEILQTSATGQTGAETPQGNMSGHGFSAQQSHSFTKTFEEHGYVIGIMSIMPKATYQQGLSRMWNRRSRYDWYWPAFAHLGEQGILNKELYAQGNSDDEDIFGYAPRYDEYRHHYSSVHGQFRDTLDFWHLGRVFGELPSLSDQFLKCEPSTRIFAVENADDHCWVYINNKVKAIRPIPKFADPGYIDHI